MKSSTHSEHEGLREVVSRYESRGINADVPCEASVSPVNTFVRGADDNTVPHLSKVFQSFRRSGFALDELLAACIADGVTVIKGDRQ